MLYSEDYQKQLQQVHKEHKLNGGWGGGVSTKVKWIIPKAKTYCDKRISSVLDYGCGSGKFKEECNKLFPEIEVSEYDPGVLGKDSPPEPKDFVVCVDVLEHIEPNSLDEVLQHIRDLNTYGALLQPCLVKADTLLPDGRNAHLIVKSAYWWLSQFEKYFERRHIHYATQYHIAVFVENK